MCFRPRPCADPELGDSPLELDRQQVEHIHDRGGTILGSSRGTQDPARVVDFLEAREIDFLFCIGGGLFAFLVGLAHFASFLAKVIAFIIFFIWIRWTIPRFRYDQLMRLGWVFFFEIALANIFVTAGIMMIVNRFGGNQ